MRGGEEVKKKKKTITLNHDTLQKDNSKYIKISVIEGKNLLAADSNGLSDPFCDIFYNHLEKQTTKIIYKTLNPQWNEEFKFNPSTNILFDVIHFVVWDKDKFGKDFLGQCCLPLSAVVHKPDTEVEFWMPLRAEKDEGKKSKKKSRGEIHIKILYHIESETKFDVKDQNAAIQFRTKASEVMSAPLWEIDEEEIKRGKLLAQGTNATVYIGEYRGQKVAIKVLKAPQDPVQMKDFQTEFDILSELKSPYLVLFYGACITEELSMVFEFCDKGSLYDVLCNKELEMSWKNIFKISVQVVQAINALHEWNPQILHRDIKTLNYLVDRFWNIKLADLGLSRADQEDNSETLNKVRGTYQYSAPETYQSKVKYSAKSDVYSIGIILWELATRGILGEYMTPFKEYNLPMPFQILIKVAKEDLRPTIDQRCPEEFAKLISTVWDKDPNVRPSSGKLITILRNMATETYIPNKRKWDSALAIGPKSDSHYKKYEVEKKFTNEEIRLDNNNNNSGNNEHQKKPVNNTITVNSKNPSQWICYSVKDLKNLNLVKDENEKKKGDDN